MMKIQEVFYNLRKISDKIERVGNSKVLSAILYQREIISVGWNQSKTHPLQYQYRKNDHCIWLHAEIDSIRKVRRFENLNQCIMVVCRVRNDGQWGLARPCENGCMGAIVSFGIKEVIYSLNGMELDYQSLTF